MCGIGFELKSNAQNRIKYARDRFFDSSISCSKPVALQKING